MLGQLKNTTRISLEQEHEENSTMIQQHTEDSTQYKGSTLNETTRNTWNRHKRKRVSRGWAGGSKAENECKSTQIVTQKSWHC